MSAKLDSFAGFGREFALTSLISIQFLQKIEKERDSRTAESLKDEPTGKKQKETRANHHKS